MGIEELGYYPLNDKPYFDNDKYWVSPFNFIPENIEDYPQKIIIHDCTLRDGEQTPGVLFTKNERIRIAEQLSELGVDRIEIGMPIISEELREAIKFLVKKGLKSEIVAFARAHPDDLKLSIECGVKTIIIEHTVNPYLCKYAYGLEIEDIYKRVYDNVLKAKKAGLYTVFMGWDFTRTPLEFSKKIYDKAIEAGADSITVVDTFAVATPNAISYAIKKMKNWYPDTPIEFHVHNDFGLGMANALAAAENGATVIHTAMNALGERTGNLATEEVAAVFGILLGGRTNINLEKLYETSKLISDITRIEPASNKTIFGKNTFLIESGVVSHYTDALRSAGFKPIAYPFMPEVVGRKEQEFLLGYGSGKLTINYYLKKNGMNANEYQADIVLKMVKEECLLRRRLLTEDEFRVIAQKVIG